MGDVLLSAGAAQVLPLAAVGALVYYLTRPVAHPTIDGTQTEEQRVRAQHLAEMEANGMSLQVFKNLSHDYITQGGHFRGNMHIDTRGNGYDPQKNAQHMRSMFQDQVNINSHARNEHARMFRAETGIILPNKRQPNIQALSREITHPNDPSRSSEMEFNQDLPNEPNPTQIKEAKKLRDSLTREDQALRRDYETAMFTRAPGQSFRWQGTV